MISGNWLLRPMISYALSVLIWALVLGQFAPVVRTQVRNPLCANLPCEPGRPACYQKLWFPGGSCHSGFHGIAGSRWPQRQPIRSQVFSGSTVSKATHCVGVSTAQTLGGWYPYGDRGEA